MKILVIGCGYQGKKHCLNLKELGAEVSVYDKDPTVMAWVIQEKFEWVEDLSDDILFDGAVIASPPEFHIDNIVLIDHIPFLLIEKPLALRMGKLLSDYAGDGKENDIMMAHNYLFMPELHKFKREIIGPLRANRHWQYVSADYMPNWHGVEFLEGYKDRHEARDGCMAISVSHAIYILDYLFGMPEREEYYKDNFPGIETRGDNSVQGIRVNDGSTVTLIETWVSKNERLHRLNELGSQHRFDWVQHNEEVLGSHKLMMKRFLDVIEGAREVPELCRLEEGIRIVKAIESATYLENEYE